MGFEDLNQAIARAAEIERIREAQQKEADHAAELSRTAAAASRAREESQAAEEIEGLISAFQRALVAHGMPGTEVAEVRPTKKRMFGRGPFHIRLAVIPNAFQEWSISGSQIDGGNSEWRSGSCDLTVGHETAFVGRSAMTLDSAVYEARRTSAEPVCGLRRLLATYPSDYSADRSHALANVSLVRNALVTWIARNAPDIRLEG